jgi:hypothetical protein
LAMLCSFAAGAGGVDPAQAPGFFKENEAASVPRRQG